MKIPLLTNRNKVDSQKSLENVSQIFKDLIFVFIPYGQELTKQRIKILEKQAERRGAEFLEYQYFFWEFHPDKQIYIIINPLMPWEHLSNIVHKDYIDKTSSFVYIDREWVSECLRTEQVVDISPFWSIHPDQMKNMTHDKKNEVGSKASEEQNKEVSTRANSTIIPEEQPNDDHNNKTEFESNTSLKDEDMLLVKGAPVSRKYFTTLRLIKNSRKLFDYSLDDGDHHHHEPEDADNMSHLNKSFIHSPKSIKAEDINPKTEMLHRYDKDVVFIHPNTEYYDIKEENKVKDEIGAKSEAGIKGEYKWFDPTFLGDEDVFVSDAQQVKREFNTIEDTEGTVIEGIEDFSKVNKTEEGDDFHVKVEKMLNPGQKKRDKELEAHKDEFACQAYSTNANLNPEITSELEKVMKTYENIRDKGRVHGYRRAITALKTHPKKIQNGKDIDEVIGVGPKINAKILEILKTGSLRKARILENDEQVRTIDLFTSVWGIGLGKAHELYRMGYRTIDDLRNHRNDLNEHQKLGIKYFEDLKQRIPRAEVTRIVEIVKQKVDEISDVKGVFEVIACGSYRRQRPMSGDIDILMTRKDGKSSNGFLKKLVNSLEGTLITDHLNEAKMGNHRSENYMGWVMLPDVKIHRRIDMKIYPREEYGFAVLYFTGSQNFNRSMRLFAKKKGFNLSDHGLYPTNRINNEMVWQGNSVGCFTEQEVFNALGLDYRKPEDRDIG